MKKGHDWWWFAHMSIYIFEDSPRSSSKETPCIMDMKIAKRYWRTIRVFMGSYIIHHNAICNICMINHFLFWIWTVMRFLNVQNSNRRNIKLPPRDLRDLPKNNLSKSCPKLILSNLPSHLRDLLDGTEIVFGGLCAPHLNKYPPNQNLAPPHLPPFLSAQRQRNPQYFDP